jgi:hypothetical protein
MNDLVVVASYATAIEAHLVRTFLESEGIPCLIANEYEVLPYVNMLYNVEVKVRTEDEERARQLLREAGDFSSQD